MLILQSLIWKKMALEVFIFWNYFSQFSNNVMKQFA